MSGLFCVTLFRTRGCTPCAATAAIPAHFAAETVCWRREREQLEQEYKDIQAELSPLHADAKKLWAIHYNIYEVQHEQERQNAATRQKKQEMEH